MRVLLLFCFLISLSLEGQEHFTPLGRDQLVADLSELIENKPDNALAVIEQWMLSYQHHKLVTHEDLCKVYKAQALIELDSTEKAIQLLNSLLNKSDPYTEALALKILAGIDFKNGRFFSSTTKIRSALELAKSNHEEELMAELQEDLALVFDKISKPDKAIHFYRRSLLLFTKLNKSSAMQKNALALGRIYLDLERLDSAMFFINQSLELAQLKKNIPAIYESKIELANFYYTNKNYTELNTIIQEIEQAKDTPKEDFFKVRLHVLKGNYAMAVSSEEKALEEFNKAEALSHQGFTPFIDYYIKSNLAEAYYRNGNVQKAYELIKYLNHNSTSYSSKENSKLAEAIESNSEVHIRDREIDYLKIQNQLKEERIRRELLFQAGLKRENQLKDYTLKQEHQLHEAAVREQALQSQQLQQEQVMSQALVRENDLRKATLVDEQNFQTVLWFGIILLMGLSLLVFFLLRKQQEKNAIIIKQTNDLEFINKEVHHRVKNNLQVISSLLDLQSKYAQDNGYQNLLMESKHRVQSMAFIHQNLYASAGLNMVDMPNYVLNLVDHLVTAYQKEGEKVNIQVEVDPIQLHMDTVVSIGMIINELVTNALKYAFYNLGGGTIQVSLKEVDEKIHLGIKDDGVGIPEGIDIAGSSSFGYKMVRAFVQKLKGKLDLNRIQGTQIQIQFSKKIAMEEINYKVRVLIVEDEPLIAENLAMYLNNNDYEVAGIAYDFEEGMLSLKEGKPDIVLLDINLEGKQDGIDLGKYIHEKLGIPFVFLSSYSDKNTLDRAKQVQPSGYLVKPFHEKTLLTTLEISLANFAGFSNPKNVDLNLDAINSSLHSPLSQREFEVLQLIYGGKTNQQISQELYISINTLKRHINNAYMRLDVNTRTTAIKKLRDLMKLK